MKTPRKNLLQSTVLLLAVVATLTGCGDRETTRQDRTSRGRNRLTLAEEMKDEPRVVRKHDKAWADEMMNRRRESRLKASLSNESRKSKIQAERSVSHRNYVRQRDTL